VNDGAPGDGTGATGATGTIKYSTSITVVTATIASGQSTATATCSGSTLAIGGGVTETDTKNLLKSGPVGTNAWIGTYNAAMSGSNTGTVTVYCIAP
jgi:hypothetical protein